MMIKEAIAYAAKEKMKRNHKGRAAKMAAGITIAAAAGTLIGVMIAPKSGKELRHDVMDSASKTIENVKGKTCEKIEEVGNKAEEMTQKMK